MVDEKKPPADRMIYIGTRRDRKGVKFAAFLVDGKDSADWYKYNSGSHAFLTIGGEYATTFTDTGYKGGLEFVQMKATDEDIERWSLEQRTHENEYAATQKVKKLKQESSEAWKRKIDPLRKMYRETAPSQRTVFLAMVIRELTK